MAGAAQVDNGPRHIAVLTSGGDAPGMNAAVRAVVRTGIERGWRVSGIRHGYAGLVDGNFVELNRRAVGGIIQRGGTILGSSRRPDFKLDATQEEAIRVLRLHGVDALAVIGGDGSQAGAVALHRKHFPVVGIASTIDNDLPGTDISIGVDSALAVALEAIDRIKVTASSHERAFLVEVMGRQCGYLALMAGIAGGAECVVIPEAEMEMARVACELRRAYQSGKAHAIVVVAEGARHNAEALARYFAERRDEIGFELRVTKLGHVQRGGTPGPFDRLLATRMGAAAVEHLAREEYGVMMASVGGAIRAVPLDEVASRKKTLDMDLVRLAAVLAR